MPRNRLIQSKFWSDDKILKISVQARLLFISLWTFTEDTGIHRDDNTMLKAQAFPADDISINEIEIYKNELISKGLILSFTDERDGELLFIKNWYKYQYIQKPTPSKYKLPEEIIKNFNDDELEKYKKRVVSDDYRSSMGAVPPNRKEKKGKEIKKNEKNEKELLKEDENNDISTNPFKHLQKCLPSNRNK